MKCVCPCCGCHGSLEAFTSDEEARRFMVMITELPAGLSPSAARRYVALFRPHDRGLRWSRACIVLTELVDLVKAGGVTVRGAYFPASAALFSSAIEEMLMEPGRLVLPLKSHGYLSAVIARKSAPEATKAENAAEEQKRETSQRRHVQIETSEQRMQRMREEDQQREAREMLRKTGVRP
ncbi:hypothetical protein [Hydrocarboniphaga effusa]|uniref:hypothetical protein n=1 Tax=Hydrocarboniphaga effusa TaxID=243629 RepID=UPI003BAC47D4